MINGFNVLMFKKTRQDKTRQDKTRQDKTRHPTVLIRRLDCIYPADELYRGVGSNFTSWI